MGGLTMAMFVRCGALAILFGLALGLPSHIGDQWAEATSKVSSKVNFVRNDDIQNVLPVAPADYPEALQGMLWMDQTGFYGFSNISGGAPDLALSMGDTEYSTLKDNSINIDIFGPGWQWQNSATGMDEFSSLQQHIMGPLPPFDHYEFEFSNDYEFCQIYPHIKLPFGASVRVPKQLVSFTMTRQHPPEGVCPPAAGASRQEISQCAKWRRDSVMGGSLQVYYAYQIVDNNRQPIQPYYDAYLAYANSKSIPDVTVAQKHGFDTSSTVDGADGAQVGTSFIGVRS